MKALTSGHNSEQATKHGPQWKEAQTIVWEERSRFRQESIVWFQSSTDSNGERVAKIQSFLSPTDAVC